MNNSIIKLTEYFNRFPGVGDRQSKRFIYHLLTKDPGYLKDLAKTIERLRNDIIQCRECFRYFVNDAQTDQCPICADSRRNKKLLMIIEKDIDLENIHRTGLYDGYYFVLGALVPIIEKKSMERVRIDPLRKVIEERGKEGLKEIIFALSANVEGDHTTDFVSNNIKDICKSVHIKTSRLGRGLSTGTELEYSDADTIGNALKNRQ